MSVVVIYLRVGENSRLKHNKNLLVLGDRITTLHGNILLVWFQKGSICNVRRTANFQGEK